MQGRDLSEIKQGTQDKLKTYISQLIDSIEEIEGKAIKGKVLLIQWQESILGYNPTKAETIEEDFNKFEEDFYKIKEELQTKKTESYDGILVDQIVGTLTDYSGKLSAYMAQCLGKTQLLNNADMETAIQTVEASINEFKKIFNDIDSIEGFLESALTDQYIIARNALVTSYETIKRSQVDYKESADDKVKGILSKKLKEVIQAEINDFINKVNQNIYCLTNSYYPDEKSFEVGRKKCADDIEKLYSKKFPENAKDSIKELVESSVFEEYLLQRLKIIEDAKSLLKKVSENTLIPIKKAQALKKLHEDKVKEEAQKKQAIERGKKELETIVGSIKSIKDIMEVGSQFAKKMTAFKQLISSGEYKGSSFKPEKLFSVKLTQVVQSEINDFNIEVDQRIANWKKINYSNKKTCNEEFKKCCSHVNLLLEQRFSSIKNKAKGSSLTSAYEDISNCEKITLKKLKKAFKEKKIEIRENQSNNLIDDTNKQINKLIDEANEQKIERTKFITDVTAVFITAANNCKNKKDQTKLEVYWEVFVEKDLNRVMESCGFQSDSDSKEYDLNPAEQFLAYSTENPLSYNAEDLKKKKELANKLEKLCDFIPQYQLKLSEAKMTPSLRKIFEEKLEKVFYQTGKLDDLPSKAELTSFRNSLKKEEKEYLDNQTRAAITPSENPIQEQKEEINHLDFELKEEVFTDLANLQAEQKPPELKVQPTPSGPTRKKISDYFAMIDPIGVSVILGTAGGALMGTFLFPGIGTLIGAAIGSALGCAAAILGILAVNYKSICHPSTQVDEPVHVTPGNIQTDDKYTPPLGLSDNNVRMGLKGSPEEKTGWEKRRDEILDAHKAARKETRKRTQLFWNEVHVFNPPPIEPVTPPPTPPTIDPGLPEDSDFRITPSIEPVTPPPTPPTIDPELPEDSDFRITPY